MNEKYLVDVMSIGQKAIYLLLVLLWLATLYWFWTWWLNPVHIVTLTGFVLTSFVMFWITVVPIYYFFFAGKMKRPNPVLALPFGRVAMVVTKTPSEPWEVVKSTLEAMKKQDFPGSYDIWLADEDPSQETISWCNANMIRISTRKGVAEYHQKKWPRRTKCKEGNLAYFYDRYGYTSYDFVSQLDADHVPEPSYLRHMIAPFIDPEVGYVAAPSICDSNVKSSWTVRARLYAEAHLHGPLQAGSNGTGWAPLCIGSHYAVRTAALKAIGGLGPELAEDHSTTLMMNNGGWKGIFAFDAIAHGEGAGSFSDSMTQEYQWSKSLMRIALEWMPKFSKGLPLKKKIQFLFSQWWYPIFAAQMVVGILSPSIALMTGIPWVSVIYLDFLWRYFAVVFAGMLPIFFLSSQKWFRPANARVISWEAALFQIVRWPWAVIGCLNGIFDALFRTNFNFKVTPKGRDRSSPLGLLSVVPYLIIILISGFAVLNFHPGLIVEGYRWLAILDIGVYATALVVILVRHLVENYKSLWAILSTIPGIGITIVSVMMVFTVLKATPIPQKEILLSSVVPAPTYASDYVGVRTQLGPTPQPEIQSVTQFIATAIPVFPTPTPLPVIQLAEEKFYTGMYDPGKAFADYTFDIYHSFTDWNDATALDNAIQSAQKANQFPMVTVQPFHKPGLVREKVLQDISEGLYDEQIANIANSALKIYPQKLIIRWGHEMDLCTVYDWSNCAPNDFIPAYQHVVDLTRSAGASNIIWMWSPSGGNPNTPAFYPGDSYVDYIGVTGLVSEDWDRFYGYTPQPRYFAQRFDEIYVLASTFNKPLIIAELGISYSDPNIDRTKWLTDAFTVMKDKQKYPLLAGWVYFNEFTQPNPRISLLPDFRLTLDELRDAYTAVGGF